MIAFARTRIRALPGATVLAACVLFAAGCVRQAPASHADAAERAACSQHADEVYRLRNPGDVYRQDTYITATRDTPFTGIGVSSVPTRGLSGQYARDQVLRSCLNGGGSTGGVAPEAPIQPNPPSTAP